MSAFVLIIIINMQKLIKSKFTSWLKFYLKKFSLKKISLKKFYFFKCSRDPCVCCRRGPRVTQRARLQGVHARGHTHIQLGHFDRSGNYAARLLQVLRVQDLLSDAVRAHAPWHAQLSGLLAFLARSRRA